MISCKDAVRQMWEYLEGAVSEADRLAVEEHLDFCMRCCGELEFATELKTFLASQGAEDIPVEVKQRLTKTLDDL